MHLPQSVPVLWLCLISCLYLRDEETERQTKAILSNSGNWKWSQNAKGVFQKHLFHKYALFENWQPQGILHAKHSFLLSPTPNTWLAAPFLIKLINRWWHNTHSVVEKQKNTCFPFECSSVLLFRLRQTPLPESQFWFYDDCSSIIRWYRAQLRQV